MASVAATQLYHCETNTQSQRTSMAVFQLNFMMDVEIQIAYNFSVSQNIIFSLILTFKDIKTFFNFLFWGLYKNRWQARFCPIVCWSLFLKHSQEIFGIRLMAGFDGHHFPFLHFYAESISQVTGNTMPSCLVASCWRSKTSVGLLPQSAQEQHWHLPDPWLLIGYWWLGLAIALGQEYILQKHSTN